MKHLLQYTLIAWVTLICALSFGYDVAYAKPIEGITITQRINTLTQDSKKVIDTSGIKWNPISAGSNAAIGRPLRGNAKVSGIITIANDSYSAVLSATMQKIQAVVNRSLWLLAILCVIYLIYEWVLLLVKFDDEKVQTDALEAIKKVARVIGWIWLSWFIVSVIFYIVSRFA